MLRVRSELDRSFIVCLPCQPAPFGVRVCPGREETFHDNDFPACSIYRRYPLDGVPNEVTARARLLVLDLVGNIVRARHDAESTFSFLAAARALGMAAGNTGVFGDSARYTPAGAAFLNGALAHSLDFDDTHAPARCIRARR